MTPTARRFTLVTASPVSVTTQQATDSASPTEACALSLGVVLLLDVFGRIEHRRQARLRTLQTKVVS